MAKIIFFYGNSDSSRLNPRMNHSNLISLNSNLIFNNLKKSLDDFDLFYTDFRKYYHFIKKDLNLPIGNTTLLGYAIAARNEDVVASLLDNGALLFLENQNILNPIHIALMPQVISPRILSKIFYYKSNSGMIRLLSQKLDFDSPFSEFITYLFSENHEGLYTLGKLGGIDLQKRDPFGRTIMHYVGLMGDKFYLSLLKGYGADINVRDKYGLSPMHYSALSSVFSLLKFINTFDESSKYLYDSKNIFNATPITWLLYYGDSPSIDILANYDLNFNKNKLLNLKWAYHSPHKNNIKVLLKYIDYDGESYFNHMMIDSVLKGDVKFSKYLALYGVNPDKHIHYKPLNRMISALEACEIVGNKKLYWDLKSLL